MIILEFSQYKKMKFIVTTLDLFKKLVTILDNNYTWNVSLLHQGKRPDLHL